MKVNSTARYIAVDKLNSGRAINYCRGRVASLPARVSQTDRLAAPLLPSCSSTAAQLTVNTWRPFDCRDQRVKKIYSGDLIIFFSEKFDKGLSHRQLQDGAVSSCLLTYN